VAPNNFTNHSVFQQSYRPIDWDQSFFSDMTPRDFPLDTTIGREEVSPFYGALAREPDSVAIVEFPMLIGDHFNPFYYYQHFHGKRVIVGYCRDFGRGPGLAHGNIFGNTYVDQVLGRVEEPGRLRFRNMVEMADLEAIQAGGAKYVVLHRSFGAQLSRAAVPHPCLGRLEALYRQRLGPPAFEDESVCVFRVGVKPPGS